MPARMLNLMNKGHLSIGADADITVLDPKTSKAEYVVAQGHTILNKGNLLSGKPTAFCTSSGQDFYEKVGIPSIEIVPNFSKLNRRIAV